MNDKTEYQYPKTESVEIAPSVNDIQISEARNLADKALSSIQGEGNPEVYVDSQAAELLEIGRVIEDVRSKSKYGLAA